jgi:hypothetical protein
MCTALRASQVNPSRLTSTHSPEPRWIGYMASSFRSPRCLLPRPGRGACGRCGRAAAHVSSSSRSHRSFPVYRMPSCAGTTPARRPLSPSPSREVKS